jgi:hypothetical protein
MSSGRRVSLIASRSLSVGFPLRGGKVSYISSKRQVIASGFIFVDCCWKVFANKESIFLGKKSWTGAIEDCNDDDQSDSIGKGKLRVLRAFGDSPESVGSRNRDGGSNGLIGIKFELDFHCRKQQNGPETAWDNLGMKKSSIGGKQYLDYL